MTSRRGRRERGQRRSACYGDRPPHGGAEETDEPGFASVANTACSATPRCTASDTSDKRCGGARTRRRPASPVPKTTRGIGGAGAERPRSPTRRWRHHPRPAKPGRRRVLRRGHAPPAREGVGQRRGRAGVPTEGQQLRVGRRERSAGAMVGLPGREFSLRPADDQPVIMTMTVSARPCQGFRVAGEGPPMPRSLRRRRAELMSRLPIGSPIIAIAAQVAIMRRFPAPPGPLSNRRRLSPLFAARRGRPRRGDGSAGCLRGPLTESDDRDPGVGDLEYAGGADGAVGDEIRRAAFRVDGVAWGVGRSAAPGKSVAVSRPTRRSRGQAHHREWTAVRR